MKFRFKNIGPVQDAEMDLGDLTIIAGHNNTGKTYIVYTLYGFLKMWKGWPRLRRGAKSVVRKPDMRHISKQLRSNGQACFPMTEDTLQSERKTALQSLGRDFSRDAIPRVFSSQLNDFDGASLEIEYEGLDSSPDSAPVRWELPDGSSLSIEHDGQQIILSLDRAGRQPSSSDLESHLAYAYMIFLLGDIFPEPFILSAERFGISLFYRELDFTKNQLVDILQQMGDDKNRDRISPFFIIDQATSRYALPIKDNIDYTRSIPDLKRAKSELSENSLFDDIKDMMAGYYSASGDEIRFISKVRGKGRSFNIPLHLASSSVRGLSDLYFFLRYVAKENQLLIIDEPESHLDTANQIQLARLLARFVRAGLKVLVTTHSDYFIKEINNLVMLSHDFEGRKTVLKRLKYAQDDALPPDSIHAYVAEEGSLTRCEIDRFGIDMPVFDKTIDDINAAANELASRLGEQA